MNTCLYSPVIDLNCTILGASAGLPVVGPSAVSPRHKSYVVAMCVDFTKILFQRSLPATHPAEHKFRKSKHFDV